VRSRRDVRNDRSRMRSRHCSISFSQSRHLASSRLRTGDSDGNNETARASARQEIEVAQTTRCRRSGQQEAVLGITPLSGPSTCVCVEGTERSVKGVAFFLARVRWDSKARASPPTPRESSLHSGSLSPNPCQLLFRRKHQNPALGGAGVLQRNVFSEGDAEGKPGWPHWKIQPCATLIDSPRRAVRQVEEQGGGR
jgi:hypothetical protein